MKVMGTEKASGETKRKPKKWTTKKNRKKTYSEGGQLEYQPVARKINLCLAGARITLFCSSLCFCGSCKQWCMLDTDLVKPSSNLLNAEFSVHRLLTNEMGRNEHTSNESKLNSKTEMTGNVMK